MIYALNPTTLVRWVSLLTFAAAVVAVWTLSPHAASALWSAKSYVLVLPSGLLFLSTIRPIFTLVHKVTFARLWLFPMFDGEWEGEVYSNWPRIHAMMLAARGDGPTFNVLSDEVPADTAPKPIVVTATIESGLFDIKMTLTMSRTRRSHTVFVKPERHPESRPRLYYIYRQQEDGAVAVTDVRQHQGAAYLDYDAATGDLAGTYWTERQGELGLNTAGTIRMWRKGTGSRAA